MTWTPLILPFLVGALVLLVPGVVIMAFSGLPARWWGLSPALSVGTIAGSGIVWGVFGWAWGPSSVLIVTALIAIAAWALTRRRPSLASPTGGAARALVPLVVAFVFGLLVFWRMYMSVVPGPEAIGQLQDTMFHIDVVRYIIENQDGSSAHTGYMDGSANASGFYPAGWHATAALLVELTGVSIPLAATALSALLTVLVFPLSAVTLAVTVFGNSRLLIGSVGVAAQLMGAFPWRFLSWGQLYSNLMAMSLLSAVIAGLVLVFRTWASSSATQRVLRIALVGLALVGTALAQPNTVFALVVVGFAFLVNAIVLRPRSPLRKTLWVGALALGFLAGWTVLYVAPFMQRTVTWVWDSFETPAQAFGEFASLGFNGGVGQFGLAALVLVGGILVVRRRPAEAWLPGSALAFGALYVLSAGSEGRVRDFLTGFWYHDSYRLAALVALLSVPLVGFAGAAILRSLGRGSTRSRGIVFVAAAMVLAVLTVFMPGASQQREWIRLSFATDDAWMISPAEEDFLARVAEVVPPGTIVANNPYDGSGLAYGLFGTDVLFPAMDGNWLGEWDPQKKTIASELTTSGFSSEVCSAVRDLDVTYLLQLDDRWYSAGGTLPEWSGLRVDGSEPGFEPVLSEGDMALYRVTGCT
ncbi:DUF6541 family protein [Microbacterium sp. 1P10AE]|uniref:DUF6541 family protein n=1 Tax=Microbacterium sp. 1P10AE TaxID=3132286 RepID=UPI0039A26BF8